MDNNFTVIIPARFDSERFPGKVLVDINGKPMIYHVVERALEAGASKVIVATDNEQVAKAVTGLCEVQMTRSDHQSGTERLAEVVSAKQLDDGDIIVNVQGDEPFISPVLIHQVAQLLARSQSNMATLCVPISEPAEVVNPNAVKVVSNAQGKAIYFSRASIPFHRQALLHDITDASAVDLSAYRRHLGIYAYTVGYIKQYVAYAASPLEKLESLEQLRALWYGDSIAIEDAMAAAPTGIDTPEDLQRLLTQII